MTEFFDRRTYSDENLNKLEQNKSLNPETIAAIRERRNSMLDEAAGQAATNDAVSSLEQKRANLDLQKAELSQKINEDVTEGSGGFLGFFKQKLTPEEAKAKRIGEAEDIAKQEYDIEQAQAKLQMPGAGMQNASVGPGQPMTAIGPQSVDGMNPVPGMEAPNTGGIDLMQQGFQRQMEAADQAGKQNAAFLGAQAKALEDQQKQQALLQQQNQKKIQERQAQIDEETAKLDSQKLDPDRYINSLSTGQKILAVIGSALGGYSGNTQAANMLQNAIAQDIEKQKLTIADRRQKLGDKINSFERFKDITKDEETAGYAAMDMGLKVAQIKMQQMAAKTNSIDQQGKLMSLAGELDVKRQELRAKMQESMGRNLILGSGAAAQLSPEMIPEKDRGRFVPGYGFALNDKEGEKMRTAVEAKTNIMKNLDKMIGLREEHRAEFFNRNAVSEGETLATDTQLILKELSNLGVLSGPDLKLMEKIIPSDPLNVGFTANKLAAAKELINRKFNEKLKAQGLQPQGNTIGFKPVK